MFMTPVDAIDPASNITVFGPSHAVRMLHLVEQGLFPGELQGLEIVGAGGMPIWSPRIEASLKREARRKKAFFIVGDFRMGNVVIRNEPGTLEAPRNEYLVIDKDLIGDENDRLMYGVCRDAIGRLAASHDGIEKRFLFWDLAIREYENRKAARYTVDGVYLHPNWNLLDVLDELGPVAVDNRDMLEHGGSLYIDSSGHPSLVGWAYLVGKMMERPDRRIPDIQAGYRDALLAALETAFGPGRSIVITGDSKFTRILARHLDERMFFVPEGVRVLSMDKALSADADTCLYFPPLTAHTLQEPQLRAAMESSGQRASGLRRRFRNLAVLPYDNWAYEQVSKRPHYKGKYVSPLELGRTESIERELCAPDQTYRLTHSDSYERIIEQSDTLIPTAYGFMHILMRAVAGASVHEVDHCYADVCQAIF